MYRWPPFIYECTECTEDTYTGIRQVYGGGGGGGGPSAVRSVKQHEEARRDSGYFAARRSEIYISECLGGAGGEGVEE